MRRKGTDGKFIRQTPEARFWNHVTVGNPDECWEWQGYRVPQGYGQMSNGTPGAGGKKVYAHRVSYAIHHGPIPPGKQVLHSCDNPPCCNPRHLRAGTAWDNVHDAIDRGRARSGCANPLKGIDNPRAVLTEDAVLEIRRVHASGAASLRGLATKFGVSKSLVSAIVNRKTWKHLP